MPEIRPARGGKRGKGYGRTGGRREAPQHPKNGSPDVLLRNVNQMCTDQSLILTSPHLNTTYFALPAPPISFPIKKVYHGMVWGGSPGEEKAPAGAGRLGGIHKESGGSTLCRLSRRGSPGTGPVLSGPERGRQSDCFAFGSPWPSRCPLWSSFRQFPLGGE